MSDYVHEKVVRLPFPKGLIENNGYDPSDSEDELKKTLGELWEDYSDYGFRFGCTNKSVYIDWCYYHTYGEESSSWGHARLLTKKELGVIKPYFDKLKQPYEDNDLRVVDYCYYNCSEPPDCYDIVTEENDDSTLFLKERS